jgi:PTH1 family peptidyl-tRNA hydrolase
VKLIVGLGNPGSSYEATRHNVGYRVLEALAAAHCIRGWAHLLSAEYGTGMIAAQPVVLAKPLTYMNASGKAVVDLCTHFGVEPHELIVIHDDLDLPLGHIRLKMKGGDAGHYGIRSIIEHLETGEFMRIRVGIGRPATREEVVAFVLSPFTSEELPLLEEAIQHAVEKVEHLLSSV